MKDCNCSRREFIIRSSKSITAMGVGTFLLKPGIIWAEGSEGEPTILTLNLNEKGNSKLQDVGGTVFIKHPTNKKEKIIVHRESKEVVKAFKNYCTHKGGPLKAPNKDGLMVCEWHKAKFNLEGKVKKGPAKKDLEVYNAQIDGDVITISL